VTAPTAVCDRPIKGRDGKPMAIACNLAPLHLGGCARVCWEIAASAPLPAEHPMEGGAE